MTKRDYLQHQLCKGIEPIFDKYQLTNSSQTQRMPIKAALKSLDKIGSMVGKRVYILASLDLVQLLILLKHQGNDFGFNLDDWQYDKLTLLTDINDSDITNCPMFDTVKVDLNKPRTWSKEINQADIILGFPPRKKNVWQEYITWAELVAADDGWVSLYTPSDWYGHRRKDGATQVNLYERIFSYWNLSYADVRGKMSVWAMQLNRPAYTNTTLIRSDKVELVDIREDKLF